MDRNRGIDISSLRQQMEDLFEDFFPSGGARRPQAGRNGGDQPQQLALNVFESGEAIVVTAPLPGFSPEELEISVRGQSLHVRGQAKPSAADRPPYLRREWGAGPFQRTLELPGPVDADKADASFRNGVVTITLPKADPNKARVIHLDDDEPTAAEEPSFAAPVEITEVPVVEEAVAQPEAATAPAETPAEAPVEEVPTSFYMRPPRRRGGGGQSRAEREAARRAAAAEKGSVETADAPATTTDAEFQGSSQE
jgi:HSP20 family protein